MKKSLFAVCFIFICLLIHGCATTPEITKLTDVWNYEKRPVEYLDKTLIVGKPRSETNRIQYEDYIAKALKKSKVDTISSYTVIPVMEDLNRESIKRAANFAGVKTVLVSKVVGIDEENVIFKQTIKQDMVTRGSVMYMRTFVEPGRVEKFTKVRLETGLFEVESEKLIWAANSTIMNPGSADEAIKDFSMAIIQQLMKDGYIRDPFSQHGN
jgi:hypothetical protein